MSANLGIVITAKDLASAPIKGIHGAASGLAGGIKNVASVAAGFALGGGLLEMPGLLFDAATAAGEDAASTIKLQKAIENTGASWDTYAGQLGTVVDSGIALGFADSDTRDALSLMAAQTGSTEEAVKRLAMAQDLARGANIDMGTAAKLLGKVTEDNVSVLSRYGIQVAKGASETELFGAIQAKFGGQAQAFADSTAGRMAELKLQAGEFQEAVGTMALPALTALTGFATRELIPVFQLQLIPAFQAVGDIGAKAFGGDLSGAIVDVQTAVADNAPKIWSQLQVWAGQFIAWLGPVIPALLIELGKLLAQFATWWYGTAVPAITEQLATWADAFVAWIGPMIPPFLVELGSLAQQAVAWIVAEVPIIAEQLATWATEFIAWVEPMIPPLLIELGNLLSGLLDWLIINAPILASTFIREWVPAAIGWVAQTAIDILPKLAELMANVVTWIITTGIPKLVEAGFKTGQELIGGIMDGLGSLAKQLEDKLLDLLVFDFGWVTLSARNGVSFNIPTPSITMPSLPGGGGGGGGGGSAEFGDPNRSIGIPGIDDVPAMAAGGIVRRPTLALVGESGPEAVVPLGRYGARGERPIVIYLQVDGRTLAQVVTTEQEYDRSIA